MNALELSDVRKIYTMGDGSDVVALDHATLTVADDEIVALVGPSGSGKTTLCSIAGGILSPTEGRIVVAGEDISNYGDKQLTRFRQESIGFVFQSVNLVPGIDSRHPGLTSGEDNQRATKWQSSYVARTQPAVGQAHAAHRRRIAAVASVRSDVEAAWRSGPRKRAAVGGGSGSGSDSSDSEDDETHHMAVKSGITTLSSSAVTRKLLKKGEAL